MLLDFLRPRRRGDILFTWTRTDPKTVEDIAEACVERARAMRWHENLSAQHALEFFLGASVGCVAGGNTDLANKVAWAATNIVAKRGMDGVLAIARREERLK